MKSGFYRRLGVSNIKKNRKIYFPYILASMGMVMMFYIISNLANDAEVGEFTKGAVLQIILRLGMIVIGVFSIIFLFYTNSFLIKRRKTELGLYNVLGMGKTHIAKILWWESLVVAFISIAGGILSGIVFSKLGQVILLRMMSGEISYTFNISLKDIGITAALFMGIFLLLYFNSIRQVAMSSTIDLLYSVNQGEKEPKANFVLALIGLLLLAGGYFIALRVDDPMSAIMLFFIAVILVILGTYSLFISGSVALLKMLKSNKKYYYKTNHFVSTSSMIYRMKRNGAGLASICILSTMVLVMLSSTACMYMGADSAVKARYPRMFAVDYRLATSEKDTLEAAVAGIDTIVAETLKGVGGKEENSVRYHTCDFTALNENGVLTAIPTSYTGDELDVTLITLEDFNRANGTEFTLSPGEALCFDINEAINSDILKVGELQYNLTQIENEDYVSVGNEAIDIVNSKYVIVSDSSVLFDIYDSAKDIDETGASLGYYAAFDTEKNDKLTETIENALMSNLNDANIYSGFSPTYERAYISFDFAEQQKSDFYSIYGGMFFLGIILSITFLLATIMMMYYKQVIEGYDDKSKFDILRKVGMTGEEIKKSINSQVLTVFFAPLLVSGLHIAFAFHMIRLMLMTFGIYNTGLLVITTVVAFILFAALYVVVYLETSKAYYKIVSEAR